MTTIALPRRREAVGMVVATPAAVVSTSPPALVKATVDMGSMKGAGAALEKERRQIVMVNTIKP